jgi:hypothetical protein
MPIYKNVTGRDVTVFSRNAIPVLFKAGQSRYVDEEGLEKKYRVFLRVVPQKKDITEGTENQTKVEKKGELISEVKQPTAGKELLNEPIKEEMKRKAGRPKKIDQYTSILSERTIGKSTDDKSEA